MARRKPLARSGRAVTDPREIARLSRTPLFTQDFLDALVDGHVKATARKPVRAADKKQKPVDIGQLTATVIETFRSMHRAIAGNLRERGKPRIAAKHVEITRAIFEIQNILRTPDRGYLEAKLKFYRGVIEDESKPR